VDPNFLGAINNLAWVLVQLKQPGAVALAERAAAAAPDHPEVLDTLAMAYISDRRLQEAVDVLKRAINRVPNPAPVRLALAKVYIDANDREKATVELEKVMEAGKSSPYYAAARQLAASLRTP
jgi:FimV-like protein